MPWRVFLCDDAPGYRKLVRAVLEPDAELDIVGEACDGQECLDKTVSAEPDLVLLDMNMPRLGGCEALPQLRKLLPDAKIVMLSTAPKGEHEEKCVRLGADAYVQKPQNVFDLPDALRAAVA